MLFRFVEFLASNETRCLDSEADRLALNIAFARKFALERKLIDAVVSPNLLLTNDQRLWDAITEIRRAYRGED